ncbi:hypothetical protein EDB87DRAFT_1645168 [Lactarius vividus]|nr:hypothetical protein EDB87DRAFT_1645168 [Lactarius vividus]
MNSTYNVDQGGFSEDKLLCRSTRVQIRRQFLHLPHILFQATVATIEYSDSAISVILMDGTKLFASHCLALRVRFRTAPGRKETSA